MSKMMRKNNKRECGCEDGTQSFRAKDKQETSEEIKQELTQEQYYETLWNVLGRPVVETSQDEISYTIKVTFIA
jgi:hypothetical protein